MSRRLLLCALALLVGCAAGPTPPAAVTTDSASSLRLIGMQQLRPDLRVQDTLVGGISGMDYDAASGDWLLVSDDRGQHGPARFYRARIAYDGETVGDVAIGAMVALRQPDDSLYPAWGRPGVSADLEALRIDPVDGGIWVTSEGDRKARVPAFVRRVDADGRHAGELPYPAALQIQPDCECGGRSNQGMEGMSFSQDGRHLWLALEGPPIQDGPLAGPGQGALTRFTLAQRDGTIVAQYVYPLDAAPAPAFRGGFVDNGISEVLVVGARRLLVLERAGRQIAGREFVFDTRLYEVDFAQASTFDPDAPLEPARVTPGVKRLLFATAQLPQGWADNYEAMAWGPPLADGRRSLVIASDNNFNGGPTRFLVFDAGLPQD
ncbi:esterase-like activity of phytase family protein [Massilia sp. CFBP9012]|uniref:esterase-like activity of phytase family protein n=1 Tax=Massilia sp. CFBP9012 TaxID=3096531 RepID=UPI002A6AF512|nr:esterase-like activity of phytase family protein [Massilia sp. CFBP9012]MDY0977257.1 esterase-like activity of phytase family protein [Massilia sp. CFBP9012]